MKTLKNRLALLLLFFLVINFCKASDTLFYAVRNVSTTWSSSKNQKSNSTEDIKKYLSESERSSSKTEDLFLVPTIIEYIGGSTDFKYIMKIDENDTKKTYDNASLIIIAINKFNTLLEYQFYLFEKKHGQTSRLAEASFFIDPNSDDYPNKIQSQVQKLFKDHHTTNKAPTARIRLDNELIEANDKNIYYRTTADAIVLDGTSSEDDNTSKKHFQYSWSVTKAGHPNAFLPDFKYEESQQKLVIPDTGTYRFSLVVSDGIAESEDGTAVVTIRVMQRPHISVFKNATYIVQSSGYIKESKKMFYKNLDGIRFYLDDDQPGTQLRIGYLGSEANGRKYLLDDYKKTTSIDLEYNDTTSKPAKNDFYEMPGLLVDTSSIKLPKGYFTYALSDDIKPGTHAYSLTAEFENVKSNVDTISITYVEKSALNFILGIDRTRVKIYDDLPSPNIDNVRSSAYSFKFGFRYYLMERMAMDLNFFLPISQQVNTDTIEIPLFKNLYELDIGYVVFPFKTSRLRSIDSFFNFSMYGGYRTMSIDYNDFISWNLFFEIGAKARLQLFRKAPKMGNMYLEGKLGYAFKSNGFEKQLGVLEFQPTTVGLNLVYGFVK